MPKPHKGPQAFSQARRSGAHAPLASDIGRRPVETLDAQKFVQSKGQREAQGCHVAPIDHRRVRNEAHDQREEDAAEQRKGSTAQGLNEMIGRINPRPHKGQKQAPGTEENAR